MNLDEYLQNLSISFAEEDQTTDNNDSIGYLAKKKILDDKNTIFIIIDILENNQDYPNNVIFLTKTILSLLISKIELMAYTFEMLDQFSEAFLNFIIKFEESASIFSCGITTFARVPDYISNYIEPLEQFAFSKLATPGGKQYDYEFAISTLSNLVQLYHYKSSEEIEMEFYNRIRTATFPFINTEFTDYWIPANVTSIYKTYDMFSFDIFFQDHSVLDAYLSILSHANELLITDSLYDYFFTILKFFSTLFIHCRDNSDNQSQRHEIMEEYVPKTLQILPEFLMYLIDFSENEPNTNFLAGICFSIMITNFKEFKKLESYDMFFDYLMQSFICFSRLNEDDLFDFKDNIFNYYNTAIVIEENSSSNARSNSVILLNRMCNNEDQKYINRAVEILLQVDQSEEVFFLLSNIIQLINDEEMIDTVHQYIRIIFNDIGNFPINSQISFILLASSSIFLLTDEESEQILEIASSYIDELQQEEITPISRFYFTISTEIASNFIDKYKELPEKLMESIIKLCNNSFSSDTPKLIDTIFEIYPQFYEEYQNHIVLGALEVIHDILTSDIPAFSLGQREDEFVVTNLESLIFQSQNPNPNFPTSEITTSLMDCAQYEFYQEYIPLITQLLSQIIEVKANDYEQAIELSVNFFTDSKLLNYNSEIVSPILLFVYDLDFERNINLIEITLKNISSHINLYAVISDDDTLKDFIACSTLLSRLIQSLGLIPQNVYDQIAQLINDIREVRNDIPMNFIIYEILASLTLKSHGSDMQNEIENWIYLCSLGIIKTNYYRKLHFLALSFIAESFPTYANYISPILNGLENDSINSDNKEAQEFFNKFDFLFSYANFEAPFQ